MRGFNHQILNDRLSEGDSIVIVNGCCLSLTEPSEAQSF